MSTLYNSIASPWEAPANHFHLLPIRSNNQPSPARANGLPTTAEHSYFVPAPRGVPPVDGAGQHKMHTSHGFHSVVALECWKTFARKVKPGSSNETVIDGLNLDVPAIVAIARYALYRHKLFC